MQSIIKILDTLCQPNEKIVPDVIQQNICRVRNKMVLYFILFSILLMLIALPTSQSPLILKIGCFFNFCALLIFLLTCRKYKGFFSFFYFCFNTALGPCFFFHGDTRAYVGVIISVFYAPTINYFVTNSKYVLFATLGLQVYMLKGNYIAFTKLFIESYSSDIASAAICRAALLILILIFGVYGPLDFVINRVTESSFREQYKRKELEQEKLFSMGFTHEVRNFINGLSGSIQTALVLCQENTKLLYYLNNAKFCTGMLLQLMNNVLDTGKAQFGSLEIVATKDNLYETMKNTWSTSSEMIKRKELMGALVIHRNVPGQVKLDHYRLTQILLNLVSNAVKFTDKGKIQITIDFIPKMTAICPSLFPEDGEEDEGITFKNLNFSLVSNANKFMLDESVSRKYLKIQELESETGILRISVSDTGIGITEAGITKLFQQFSQVSDGDRRKQGTGLGLYITRLLCRKMGGDIKVYSKRGIGSVFTICLPVNVQ